MKRGDKNFGQILGKFHRALRVLFGISGYPAVVEGSLGNATKPASIAEVIESAGGAGENRTHE